jgi:hypothetical protein
VTDLAEKMNVQKGSHGCHFHQALNHHPYNSSKRKSRVGAGLQACNFVLQINLPPHWISLLGSKRQCFVVAQLQKSLVDSTWRRVGPYQRPFMIWMHFNPACLSLNFTMTTPSGWFSYTYKQTTYPSQAPLLLRGWFNLHADRFWYSSKHILHARETEFFQACFSNDMYSPLKPSRFPSNLVHFYWDSESSKHQIPKMKIYVWVDKEAPACT